jgi:hypothetical protein
MKVKIQTKEKMNEEIAQLFISLVKENPNCVLGLATGSSPLGVYKRLVEAYQNGEISFKDVKSFNLDEYVGLDETNDQSYRYFMNHNLFDHIDINKENGLRYSERVLPYCRKSIKARREESNIRRLTLYKSGKTFRAGILENEINDHHQNALMDITYDIRSVPYDFDPHMVMAKLHIEARNCHLCDHCVRTEDVTWCNIVKNGSTRKGTFKVEKGQKCSFFQWHDWFNYLYESYSKDLIEGKDFHIWKNDR